MFLDLFAVVHSRSTDAIRGLQVTHSLGFRKPRSSNLLEAQPECVAVGTPKISCLKVGRGCLDFVGLQMHVVITQVRALTTKLEIVHQLSRR